jgi:hypothetical protein
VDRCGIAGRHHSGNRVLCFLEGHLDFDAEPPWSWAIVLTIPLAGSMLLFLRSRRPSKVIWIACAILTLHAATVIGMLASGQSWFPIFEMSLFLDLLLIAAVLPAAVRSKPLGGFSRATVFWVSVFFGICLPVALANGIMVVSRAETIAGNRPYCIQYASQTDAFAYEGARTLFDLSALKMQSRIMAGGSTAYYFQYHGVLVVQDVGKLSFFNWSYF